MHIKNVQYSRVYSLGNYENEKIGVEVEVQEGEDPQEALKEAKKFVDLSSKTFKSKLDKANHIIKNPDDYYGREVSEAKEFINQYNETLKNNFLPAPESNKTLPKEDNEG